MTDKKEKIFRRLIGEVVSTKMEKTVVIRVDSVKTDKLYGKKINRSKNFKAHDEKNQYHEGDMVVIEEVRPISKDKRWKVIKKVK
jgi:small subunit ribosomal protein S17